MPRCPAFRQGSDLIPSIELAVINQITTRLPSTAHEGQYASGCQAHGSAGVQQGRTKSSRVLKRFTKALHSPQQLPKRKILDPGIHPNPQRIMRTLQSLFRQKLYITLQYPIDPAEPQYQD